MTARQRKQFSPVDAAYAIAQYFPADPAGWLDRAAQAGMLVAPCEGGGLLHLYHHNGVDCDGDQADFLDSWLNLTPGGTAAVEALLRKRGTKPCPPPPVPIGTVE